MFWHNKQESPALVHRGRIFWSHHEGWWRYKCYDCTYGAGSNWPGAQPWMLKIANKHYEEHSNGI